MVPTFLLCGALVASAGAGISRVPESKYFVEVKVSRLEEARDLARAGYDVAGMDRKALALGLVVTPEELDALRQLGFPVTIRSTNLAPGAIPHSDYTDPLELSAFMDQVVAAYPDLAAKSALTGPLFEGQTQYVLLITKDVALHNDRPSFVLDAQHHGREVMTTEIALDMIDYLTSRYASDPQVRRWVDSVNIYVVGSVNPDGAMHAFTSDGFWRKNRNPVCAVDNDRNYPALWDSCPGSSKVCFHEIYRGLTPGSEPESQGFMGLMDEARPFFALSYHSYGESLTYPYGCSDPDEMAALDEVAQGLKAILPNDLGVTGQYETGPSWSTSRRADGMSIDTQYNIYGAYPYVIEVNSGALGFQPDYGVWRDVTVQRQRTAWKYFLDKTLDGTQIRGSVTDAATGLPVPANLDLEEVTFTHGEAQRRANHRGKYHLLVASNGTYHVRYSHPGYCTASRQVVVSSGPATVDVALLRPVVPAGVAAQAAGDNAVHVSWVAAAGAKEYRVLRSLDAGGPYTQVAVVPGWETSYHDAPVSGGVTYHYVVRTFQGCESADSSEAQVATTGPCTAGPAFVGLRSGYNAAAETCTVHLTWPPATARCGGEVTYRVYRGTTPSFVPSSANLVASGLSGQSFSDQGALAHGTPFFYVVRAVDAIGEGEDGNARVLGATPTGPFRVGGWTDNAGDKGAAAMTMSPPWSVQPTGGKTGPKVYATGTYGNGACVSLTTPTLLVQNWSVLTFESKYDIETNHDAGVVEVAVGPDYAMWTKLEINYPDALHHPGNACGIPTDEDLGWVFSGNSATPGYAPIRYSGSLSPYVGQSVKIRWRLSSDDAGTRQGWWIDDVAVTEVLIPGACSTGAPAAR